MNNARIAVVVLIALQLSGCHSANQKQFESYAKQLVYPQMQLPSAESALVSAGFLCDTRSAYPEVTCTRHRTGFMSGCVERINLRLDGLRTSVTVVDPKLIVCTGL